MIPAGTILGRSLWAAGGCILKLMVTETIPVETEIAKLYRQPDAAKVKDFLVKHPKVAPLLVPLAGEIKRYFLDHLLGVDLVVDENPEDPSSEDMFAVIRCDIEDAEAALDLLDKFEANWWAYIAAAAEVPLHVDVEYSTYSYSV
jgi:hypothetical protein